MALGVAVGVAVGVGEAVGVGVAVGLGVAVGVGDGVGVGVAPDFQNEKGNVTAALFGVASCANRLDAESSNRSRPHFVIYGVAVGEGVGDGVGNA